MQIQSNYGVFAYQGSGKVSLQLPHGTAANLTSVKSITGGASQNSTDRVTISSAAMEKAAKEENGATQSRTAIQEKLLKSAQSDPQSAEKLASDMANTSSTIFYDISDQLASGRAGPVNKLSSGRIIDDAFKEKFSNESSVIDAQRKAIYDSEKAKGTPAAEILSKMFDFTNSQSRDYLEATCWIG